MTPSSLKPDDFLNWRNKMKWDRKHTAKRLGVTVVSIGNYERGARSDGYDVTIPLVVALAMRALERQLKPWGE